MQKIMDEDNKWDQMVETDVLQGPEEKVTRKEIVLAIQKMKSEKATGPCEVSVEMIIVSDEIGIKMMMDLRKRVLEGRGMPNERKTSMIVPIIKGIQNELWII